MKIEKDRLSAMIEKLAAFNSTPGKGITRFTYSQEDRLAREYLTGVMGEAGLSVRTDPVGNIFGRLEGREAELAPVLSGSHIDTVPHGGKYDGAVGVVCAVEALRAIVENGLKPKRPIEAAVFVEEEGPNFGSPLAGSKALIGEYSPEDLTKLVNRDGLSMFESAVRFGLQPDKMPDHVLQKNDIHAMVEVHVEQSLVLDKESVSAGVVTGISGMRLLRVTLKGESNHIGATPMIYRKDPLPAAAELMLAVEKAAREAYPSTVAGSGKLLCSPNVPNVIPERIEIYFDIRDVRKEGIEGVMKALENSCAEICARRGLDFHIEMYGTVEPAACAPRIVSALKSSADSLKIPYIEMTSGALHDAAVMAAVSDVGMLFLPSIGGRSHVPEEETRIDDIEKGCEILAESLIKLANE